VSSYTFFGNTGSSPSTINMDDGSLSTIANSIFPNNAVTGAGTVLANPLTIVDSTFYNNMQSRSARIIGAAILASNIVAVSKWSSNFHRQLQLRHTE